MLTEQIFIILLVVFPLASAAQSCKLDSTHATTPTSQFTDNGDGTVTDNKTGLIWKKCSEGQTYSLSGCSGGALTYTWKEALNQAQVTNNTGGFLNYTDWRVPNINELRSIAEKQCWEPTINLTIFPNTPSNWFWSSSPFIFKQGFVSRPV